MIRVDLTTNEVSAALKRLSTTLYGAAYAAVEGMKGDGGRPLGLKPNLLVVPPTLRSAAQTGRRALSEAVSESMALSTKTLREIGVVAELSGLVKVEGDSMLPTIRNGSLALVDFRPTSPTVRSGHIYVYSVGDEVFIKRLANISEEGVPGLLISSDNPNYPPISLFGREAEEVRVVGRVCGAFTKF